jgi:hypothetical protein
MNEINIYLTNLVSQKKLSYPEAGFFLDFAYDLVLNDINDEEIESLVIKEIAKHIEGK